MLQLFLACLLMWLVIIAVFFVFIGNLIIGLLDGFFGALFLISMVPALITTLFIHQADKIKQLEQRISHLEKLKKENLS